MIDTFEYLLFWNQEYFGTLLTTYLKGVFVEQRLIRKK